MDFLTKPKVPEAGTRCYMRAPDGHLIEVDGAKEYVLTRILNDLGAILRASPLL